MPLTAKGEEILSSMKKEYGSEHGERVFYASKNAGVISGVDSDEVDCAMGDSQKPYISLIDGWWEALDMNGKVLYRSQHKNDPRLKEAVERAFKAYNSRPLNNRKDNVQSAMLNTMVEQVASLGNRAAALVRRMDAGKHPQWYEGKKAAEEGKPVTACPYRHGSVAWFRWYAGFKEGGGIR